MKMFAAALLLAGTSPAFAAVANGSFEQPGNATAYEYYGTGSTAITGWTVTRNQIARLGNGVGGVSAADGVEFLDLTGSCDCGIYGGVTQSVSTVVDQIYTLSFFGGNYRTNGAAAIGLTAMIDGVGTNFFIDPVGATGPSFAWTEFSLSFAATSAATQIEIFAFGPTNSATAYVGLDKVSITAAPAAPVPEPATWAMMMIGFGGIGAYLRRPRRTVAFA